MTLPIYNYPINVLARCPEKGVHMRRLTYPSNTPMNKVQEMVRIDLGALPTQRVEYAIQED